MLPYLLLIFVPVLFSCIAPVVTEKDGRKRRSLAIGTTPDVVNRSLLVPAFFVGFFVLLVLRDETVGSDLSTYKWYFDAYAGANIETFGSDVVAYGKHFSEAAGVDFSVIATGRDPLYWLLTFIVSRFTDNFQWFVAIVAGITLFPMAKVYSKERDNGFLKVLLFMNLPTFVMIFSGLRQALAMSFGLLAYEYVRDKKIVRFLLTTLVAFGFHHTGFIILLFYPLYHITFKKKHLIFVVPAITLTFIFNRPIFTFATDLLNRVFGEDYNATIQSTGAYTMLILFVLFAIFAYVLPDEEKMDKDAMGLRNFLLMSVFLQCFAPLHSLAMRMNYYFILFIPLLIPKILKCVKPNLKGLADVAKLVMVVFFLAYYVIDTYIACQTGVSAFSTYPYLPFWQ